MKAWLKWLANTDYKFTVKHDTEAREYNFGNGLIVVKYESKHGGMIINNGYTSFHGSVKDLTKNIEEILSK